MAKHAILSPSAASRWLACTPSARLEEQFPDTRSEAAAEGTLAHALAELEIGMALQRVTGKAYKAEKDKLKRSTYYDHAMEEHVGTYAAYVIEQFNAAKARTSDAVIHLEQTVDLTRYIEEGFGTIDIKIIADHTLRIIDLKYGKGVPVSAVENKQMMLYALGAYEQFEMLYDLQEVQMTIYQPRIDNITDWIISVPDLLKWAAEELQPRAKLAFAGEGEYKAGEHCRFCKAKAVCKANADFNMEIAKYDFAPGHLLDDAAVADILSRADLFSKWIAAVEEHALNAAVNDGKRWPGFKLVEGRSNRQYGDQEAVEQALLSAGFKGDKIYAPKSLLGITAMEKSIGKAAFSEHLSNLIIKPAGKPALVPESDERPEYNSAESAAVDFAQ